MMRRTGKKWAALLCALLALSLSVGALAATAQSVAQLATNLGAKYGVAIYTDRVDDYWGTQLYYALETDYGALERHLQRLDATFARYPQGFFEAAQLESVSVVKAMSYTPKLNGQIQGVTGNSRSGAMYMIMRSDSTSYVYDHEISHLVDEFRIVSDRDWARLNVPGFRYTGGFLTGDVLPPGMVSNYSAWAVYEDRAELFAYVMDDSRLEYMKALASHDSVLRAKLELLKKYIHDVMHSPGIEARIDALLGVPEAKPLYYITTSAAGRTGPGEQYIEVKLNTSGTLGVVQSGSRYVKALIDGVGVYFPADAITRVDAPQTGESEQPDEINIPQTEAADMLLALGLTFTAAPRASKSVTGEQILDEQTLETILSAVYTVVKAEGFASEFITVVRGLRVNGQTHPYAYTNRTLYIDADAFTAKTFAEFNAALLKKYGQRPAA